MTHSGLRGNAAGARVGIEGHEGRGRVGVLHSPAPLCHAIHREGFGVDTKYY
jgi:hypothetical protein